MIDSDWRLGLSLISALGALMFFCGCTSTADKAWYAAYRSNFDYYSLEGEGKAAKVDISDSSSAGRRDARRAIDQCTAWELYRPLAIWSAVIGLIGGVVAQYLVLFACRWRQKLPLLLASATVPGLRLARSFEILELRTETEIGKEATDIELQHRLFRIRAIHQLVTRKLLAADNLDQLTQSRLLELANIEFEKIVSSAERKYGVTVSKSQQDLLRVNCPNCNKLVRYSRHFVGQSRPCPNVECKQIIEFPA